MNRKKRTPVTEETVNKVLKLSAAKLSTNQISRLLGLSSNVVLRIKNAGSWEGYQQYKRAQAEYVKRLYAKKKTSEAVSKREKESMAKGAWNVAEEPRVEDLYEQLRETNLKLDQIINILIEKENKKENGFKPF